jgi:putative aldouronate transport system substrate-binding protein
MQVNSKAKWLAVVSVTVLMVATVTSGCVKGGKSASPSPSSSSSAPVDSSTPSETGGGQQKGDSSKWFKQPEPAVTFTQNKWEAETAVYQPGDSMENNGYTRWLKDELGIAVEPKWKAANLETDVQKLNLGAASGGLPDVIGAEAPVLGNLAQQGLLLPLNDLIDQYGSPLTKYIIEQSQKDAKGKLFSPFTLDGKLYAFPKMVDRMAYWSTNWIRKDIVEGLGKPMPATLAEFENLMTAYKQKYPQGTAYLLDKDMTGLDLLAQAYDAQPKKWKLNGSGEVVYGSTQPEMKEALLKLNEWYGKGFINREFIAKLNDNITADFTSGNALTWIGANGQWWNVYFPFPDLWKNVPKADMAAMPTLQGADGRRGVIIDTVSNYGVAINAKYDHPEVIIQLYNEQLDSLYRSDENIRAEMSKRGYTFKYPVTTLQAPLNPGEKESTLFKFNYEKPGWGWFNDFSTNDGLAWGFQGRLGSETVTRLDRISKAIQKGGKDGLTASEANDYDGLLAEPQRPKAFVSVMGVWQEREQSDYVKANIYPGVPTPTMTLKKAYLDKLESETFAKIIMGQESADAFDRFVDDWNKGGGVEITKEINDWYQANN